MAVLAAYDIAHLFPFQSVQVYTVGAPRPGNKALLPSMKPGFRPPGISSTPRQASCQAAVNDSQRQLAVQLCEHSTCVCSVHVYTESVCMCVYNFL